MNDSEPKQPPSMKPFFVLWGGQAVSLLGSQLVQFALIWWLTQTTGSATVLAMSTLAGMLPQVALGPFVGVLVDRWNRRLTMMAADAVVALATLALAYLFWVDVVQVWHVFVILFIRALGGGFHYPAMQSSTSLMVPEAQLTRIQGLNQALNGGMNIAAAPLGALLLGVLPIQGILMIDVGTAVFAIVPLIFIFVPQPERQTAESPSERASFAGLIGIGAGTLLIGFAPANAFFLAVVGAVVVGGTISLANGPIIAIFQACIEPEMQGRVFTLLTSLASGMAPLGLVIAGPVADALGVQAWFIVGGFVTLIMGGVGYLIPSLLQVENGRSPVHPVTAVAD